MPETPRSHPFVRFNNATGEGEANGDWHPTDDTQVPDGLTQTNLQDRLYRITDPERVVLGTYVDGNTGQRLRTLWVNKDRLNAKPNEPVTIFMQGFGSHVDHPDMQTRAGLLSIALGHSPVFQVDYPNVRGSDGFTDEQKRSLKNYDATPILKTWVEAMKSEGLEGREVQIAGESLGGFFGVELALFISKMENPPFNISRLHIVDPAGVHKYDDRFKPLRAAHYVLDFLNDAKYNDLYVKSVTDPISQFAMGIDVPTLVRKKNEVKWVLTQLLAERPPIFYLGSLLAHGGLPEKLDELLKTNQKLHLTITNMTNSLVCPTDEMSVMLNGPKNGNDDSKPAGLLGLYKGRVRAFLLAGDAHSAIVAQRRTVYLHADAFRNKKP